VPSKEVHIGAEKKQQKKTTGCMQKRESGGKVQGSSVGPKEGISCHKILQNGSGRKRSKQRIQGKPEDRVYES